MKSTALATALVAAFAVAGCSPTEVPVTPAVVEILPVTGSFAAPTAKWVPPVQRQLESPLDVQEAAFVAALDALSVVYPSKDMVVDLGRWVCAAAVADVPGPGLQRAVLIKGSGLWTSSEAELLVRASVNAFCAGQVPA